MITHKCQKLGKYKELGQRGQELLNLLKYLDKRLLGQPEILETWTLEIFRYFWDMEPLLAKLS